MKIKKLDAVFGIVLVLTAVIALLTLQVSGEPEPTVAVVETTMPSPIEPTGPATPAEPELALYDVPLERDLQIYIISLCEEKNIDPAIVIAMIEKESGYNEWANGDGGDSYGLMQVQPKWHYERMTELGCTDLYDPFQNVTVGIDYLEEMLLWYDGDVAAALVAYNQGRYKGTVTQYAQDVMAIAEEVSI